MGHALPHHDCKVSVIILKLKSTGSIFHSHNLSPLIFYRATTLSHRRQSSTPINEKIPAASPKRKPRGNTPVGVDGFEPPTLCL